MVVDTKKAFGLFYLKLLLLLLWGAWFSLAFLTDFFDFLYALNLLPSQWAFKSNNYALIVSVVNTYTMPKVTGAFLFMGDILLLLLSAICFLTATVFFWQKRSAWPAINLAFSFSILLWILFLIIEEIFIAYLYESVHLRLLIAELISLLAIHLLPEN